MSTKTKSRQCPFCKEQIKADALRCKHCRSSIEPEPTPHGGVCPWCKESIHVDAIKCKYCGSAVGAAAGSKDCGCHQSEAVIGGSTVGVGAGSFNPDISGENVAGGVSASAAATGCGDCTGFNGTTHDIRGNIRIRGTKQCCTMVPILIGDRVIWRKVCWSESCIHKDIYSPT